MPSQRQPKVQDPRLHEMATEQQALQAKAAGMQQRRVKLPKIPAGCASSLPATCGSHLEVQKPSGGLSQEASPLPEQGHLLEEILLTGFLAPSWGTRCPLGVPWSPASVLAVMPDSFPAERASRCPVATGGWGHSKYLRRVFWWGIFLF